MLRLYKTILAAVFFLSFILIIKFVFDYRTSLDRETILMRIHNSNYCEIDNDCVFINSPCNIVGCGIAVNKNEAPQIKFLADSYNFPYIERTCDIQCQPVIGLRCVNNLCDIIIKKQ